MRYKHIVFDVDGTLIDTEQNDILSLQSALHDLRGHDRSYAELHTVFGTVGRQGLINLGYSLQDADEIYPIWYERSAATIGTGALFCGIEELLLQLREQGCCMGVVTSRQREMYQLGAQPNRFERFFPIAICMEDTEQHKPQPAPLLAYMRRAGACAKETLFVGDSIYDMQCAAAAGVDSALALWGTQDKTMPATHYVTKPQDILQFV